MKYEVGDRVRLNSAYTAFCVDDYNAGHSTGDVGTVIEVETGDKLPYRVRIDGSSANPLWFRAAVIELVDAPAQPSPSTPFRKVVTLTSNDGFEFTLSGDNVSIIRCGDDESDDGDVTIPFATLFAAVDELRKEAK